MVKHILATIAIIAVIAILGIATGRTIAQQPDTPMTQEAFPCEEDEVLGYAPEFGSEHVGCIHIDNIK